MAYYYYIFYHGELIINAVTGQMQREDNNIERSLKTMSVPRVACRAAIVKCG